MNPVYETKIINDQGLSGTVKTNTGYTFKTASVKQSDPNHSNPEQLIGAAWATCLNATIESILKTKNLSNRSRVEVTVKLWFEEKTRYHFSLDAAASIENLDLNAAEEIIHTAHKFCPISKLIGTNSHVALKIVPYAN